ncbi:MAG: zinc-ribbon domain-containing protein [Flavobacteriaceae bacterium]|nr:zinc-ribbon domain-containing protein [Flavobacteriaceae bacterium]
MILFFGMRPGKSETTLLQGTPCPHCGNSGTLELYRTPHYFHLFWIKIFPVYTSRMIECTHCKRGYFKEDFTEDMRRAIP